MHNTLPQAIKSICALLQQLMYKQHLTTSHQEIDHNKIGCLRGEQIELYRSTTHRLINYIPNSIKVYDIKYKII